jgi:hypothetical protein
MSELQNHLRKLINTRIYVVSPIAHSTEITHTILFHNQIFLVQRTQHSFFTFSLLFQPIYIHVLFINFSIR